MNLLEKLNINRNYILFGLLLIFILIQIIGHKTTHVVHAESNDESVELPTIYHVYLDDDYIGRVSDEDVVYNTINDQIDAAEEDSAYTYTLAQELALIPERVFHKELSDDQVLAELAEKAIIQVDAVALMLGDELVGYFAAEAEADQVLFEYKSKYVGEDILEDFVKQEADKIDLALDESMILDITLSKEATKSNEVVSEDELLTVNEGIKLIEKGTLEDKLHKIKAGDTLSSVAASYDLSVGQLLELNDELNEGTVLQLNQELNVTDYVSFADVIVYQEERVEETIEFEKKIEKSDDLYVGESELKQEGEDGKKDVHYSLKIVNGKEVERDLLEETVITEVVDEITIEGSKVIPSRGTGDFVWPAVGGYVSSGYGPRWGSMHNGIDIARPSNRNILAADNGTVEKVSYDANGYGHHIVINHNNGYTTLYAHLASVDVSVGDTVPQGTTIGQMGTTGRSTGIHLHFEVAENGSRIDPNGVLN
ncbi:Murein DD-endopeptidase MepM and murein hydrolase activator NlpD, contain LysM domain [Amphibacillus marinus]|uniref:Murein DD-endopeptidase MepM and murein hydrolase activator NlpD, contain LysM domain n=1 Tax=Amphibacillus marinus TaxID=872970 RepID=A0A1H8PKM3_9BACI|nr:M23 family metallopeptidase [Amphibacillus marinus]SEO42083.1 Murein DD-endopeptidase MepM and murein hydrolase activator NlpD, contain LysM domain [Amphibacillus marinus]